MKIEEELRYFIINLSNKSFEALVKNGRCYPLFLSLFSKNGIRADRLPEEDFWPILFLTIVENREELLIMMNSKDFFAVISRIANIMIKDMNRDFYRVDVKRKREQIEDVSLKAEEENDQKFSMVKIKKVIYDNSLKDQIILGAYFGLNRTYVLSIDQICSIIRVKRSSAFAKVKKFKEVIKE